MKNAAKNGLKIILFFCMANAFATSLYTENKYVSMIGDRVAKNVGDNLTVLIYEKTSASADADTKTSEVTDVSLSGADNEGAERRAIGLGTAYKGSGGVSRAGNLLASITATVVEVNDNGELLIEGNQFIELNEDKQTITLKGRLRIEDIGKNNTVISSRLSDAKITYLAEGTLADRQKPGWLSRFFNWIF
jgi:flagellar L-ring protein FlgH